ncbi:MAG: energy transducer TonB [Bacteroidetes bacterium]|nr:energy transducer TonB [Bacteroidota bacterium]
MKYYLFLVVLLLLANSYFGQEYKRPQFVGGKKAFHSYLGKYLSYPSGEMEKGTEANLTATIYISKDGKIKFVNVMGSTKEFRDPLKRILTLMPNWEPGLLNGKPVDTLITQEVYFSIEKERSKKNDTLIYESIVYQVPMSNKEFADEQKKWKDQALKQEKAKITFDKASEEVGKNNVLAIDLFHQAHSEGYPKNVLYHYNLGVAYLKAGIKDTACMNFQEAARKGDMEAYNLYLKMCR